MLQLTQIYLFFNWSSIPFLDNNFKIKTFVPFVLELITFLVNILIKYKNSAHLKRELPQSAIVPSDCRQTMDR